CAARPLEATAPARRVKQSRLIRSRFWISYVLLFCLSDCRCVPFVCGEFNFVIDLLLCLALLGLARLGTPVDDARFEARQREDHPKVAPVRVHLVQRRQSVILQAEHDPAAVGRVGTNQGLDVPTLVMCNETQMRSRSLAVRSILQNASSTPSNRSKKIRAPSGVKDGSFSQTFAVGVSSTMSLPSEFIRAMLQNGASFLSISKTICRPSGDQSGLTASASSKWVI